LAKADHEVLTEVLSTCDSNDYDVEAIFEEELASKSQTSADVVIVPPTNEPQDASVPTQEPAPKKSSTPAESASPSKSSQPPKEPAKPPAEKSGDKVKKSNNDICHAPGTTYYDRTKDYTAYDTLQDCLNSGGRLPKK
jgi:hypothetical protein